MYVIQSTFTLSGIRRIVILFILPHTHTYTHAKKQENMVNHQKKNQSTEADTEIPERIKLPDRHVKITVKNTLQMLEKIEKNMNMMRKK